MFVSTCAAFPADRVHHASTEGFSNGAGQARRACTAVHIGWYSPVIAPRSLWSDQAGAPHVRGANGSDSSHAALSTRAWEIARRKWRSVHHNTKEYLLRIQPLVIRVWQAQKHYRVEYSTRRTDTIDACRGSPRCCRSRNRPR